jgi:hypothetical protein
LREEFHIFRGKPITTWIVRLLGLPNFHAAEVFLNKTD